MSRRLLTAAVANLFVLSIGATAFAAENYEERWDAGDTNGWNANTVPNTLSRDNGLGNPAASIRTTWVTGDPISVIGANTELPAATGDFTGAPAWTVEFDAYYSFGDFTDTFLRFRYQDSTFNGWRIDVADAFPASWESYSVTFDPTWTDGEATAAGWIDETAGAISWQTLMTDVYTTEVRMQLGQDVRSSANIDNFIITAVPEPSAAGLTVLGMTAFAWRRRR